MNTQPHHRELVLSYLDLRKTVGIIGISMPFVLAISNILLGADGLEQTISDYYHSKVGDLFVGSQFAVAVFMMSYRGWDKRDELVGDLAGIGAIGVALFPVMPDVANPSKAQEIADLLHAGFAALFFFALAYFCLVLFRKTEPGSQPTARKQTRNRIYAACGYVILLCVALIGLQHFIFENAYLQEYKPIFWLESAAILAFGISWFIKGKGMLAD